MGADVEEKERSALGHRGSGRVTPSPPVVLFDRFLRAPADSAPLGLALFIVLYRLATPNNVWKLRRPVIF